MRIFINILTAGALMSSPIWAIASGAQAADMPRDQAIRECMTKATSQYPETDRSHGANAQLRYDVYANCMQSLGMAP